MNSRIKAILGPDGPQILASALQCTPQRFSYESPSSRLAAIIELLELAKERGISEAELPLRFQDTSELSPVSPAELRARFSKLFGIQALSPRLAVVLGMSKAAVASAFHAQSIRALTDLAAILELLEVLHNPSFGAKSWPERWWQINSATEMRRSTRRSPRPPIDPSRMKARIERVLGGINPSARFSRALEKSPDSLARIWRSEVDSRGRAAKVQPALAIVVELLEALQREGVPVERWPERWQAPSRRSGRPRVRVTPTALPRSIAAEG